MAASEPAYTCAFSGCMQDNSDHPGASHPTLHQPFDRRHINVASAVSCPIGPSGYSCVNVFLHQQTSNTPLKWQTRANHTSQRLTQLMNTNMESSLFVMLNTYPYMRLSTNCVIVKGIAIVAIQLQLLAFSSTAAARALLSVGIIMELLAILLAMCFVHSQNFNTARCPSTWIRLASQIPALLILMGIVGLGVTLVVETFQTSPATAVVMSGSLVVGVILCLSTSFHGSTKVKDEDNSGHGCNSS